MPFAAGVAITPGEPAPASISTIHPDVTGYCVASFGFLPLGCATVHRAIGGRPVWITTAASDSAPASVRDTESMIRNWPEPAGRSSTRQLFGTAGSQIAIEPDG